jgi:uroporphyrinogen decarboxylase
MSGPKSADRSAGGGVPDMARMEEVRAQFEEKINAAQRASSASKDFVRDAMHHKGAPRCPVRNRTLSLDVIFKYGDELADLFCRYPDDVICVYPYEFAIGHQPPDKPDRIHPVRAFTQPTVWVDEWGTEWQHAAGGVGASEMDYPLKDWSMLDRYLSEQIPHPRAPGRLDAALPLLRDFRRTKYCIGMMILVLWDRFRTLRGNLNCFMDLYDYRSEVHRLVEALTEYSLELISYWAETGIDALFLADDLGTQRSLIISRDLWREYFRIPYRRLFDEAHRVGLDVIFHSCGNIEELIPDFIDIGVDVINPLQPGAMDLSRVSRRFGGQVAFFGAIDDQNLLREGSPVQVKEEVRRIIDLLGRPFGNAFIPAPSNVIAPEVPLENIRALMEAGHGQ